VTNVLSASWRAPEKALHCSAPISVADDLCFFIAALDDTPSDSGNWQQLMLEDGILVASVHKRYQ